MKTSYKIFIFLLIIFISGANAEDNGEQNNQKISIYLHPLSSLFMLSISNIFGSEPSPSYVIYLTVEIPLSLSNSLIIQPSLWYFKDTWYGEDTKKIVDKLFRLGSGIGFRHFVNGKGDGLYFQAMSDVHYYSIKESDWLNSKGFYYKKGFYADLLGYLGYSWEYFWDNSPFRIFSDIGIGTIYPFNNSSYEILAGGYKKPFTFDINLGIGLPF